MSIVTADSPQAKEWPLADEPASRSEPVHPTQLYSSLDALVICFFLWVVYPFRRRDGEVTAWMITLYPITRFLIEIIRTDEPAILWGMSIAQNISLLLLGLAAGLWVYLYQHPAPLAFGGDKHPAPQLELAAARA